MVDDLRSVLNKIPPSVEERDARRRESGRTTLRCTGHLGLRPIAGDLTQRSPSEEEAIYHGRCVRPEARGPSTVPIVIRMPRMQGFPS